MSELSEQKVARNPALCGLLKNVQKVLLQDEKIFMAVIKVETKRVTSEDTQSHWVATNELPYLVISL